MTIENEIKLKISKPQPPIMKKIINSGFKFVKETSQVDYYFSPPHRNFAGTKKYYLRLRRRADGSAIFAYHVVVSNLQTKEREVAVDNFLMFRDILKQLNFKLNCVVNKTRKTFINKKDNFELVLDKVAGLGHFMELEYIGRPKQFKVKKIFDIINDFGLKKEQIVSGCGYPDLLNNKLKK